MRIVDYYRKKRALRKKLQTITLKSAANFQPAQPEDPMSGFITGYALNLPIGGPGALLGDIARDGCVGSCPDPTPATDHHQPSCDSHHGGSSYDSSPSCDTGSSYDGGSSGGDSGGGSDGGGSCGGSD